MNHPNTLSYWEQQTLLPPPDYAVIGSGIVGLTAAIAIAQAKPKARVYVIERGPLPEGASTRNAGFACFGSMTELLDDLSNQTEATVFDLVDLRYRGLQALRKLTGDAKIGYQARGGYELFLETEQAIFEQCTDKIEYFNNAIAEHTKLKNTFSVVKKPNFGFDKVKNAIINQHEGQIHTGMLMQRLLQLAAKAGVRILYGMTVSKLENTSKGVLLHTEAGWSLPTGKVIVASNGFARQLMPQLEVFPARNQVLVTEPIKNLPFEGCFHYDRGYFYFRNIENRILLGGGRNLDPKTEQTDAFGDNTNIQKALTQLLHEVILPNRGTIKIDYWWSGILGLGPIKRPIVESINDHTVVAVRMGGMGMAIGTLIGQQAAHLIAE
jgi:gamma-glutamylputrescine oxidase